MRKTLQIVIASLILLCAWGVSSVFAQSETGRPFITKWQGEAGKQLKIPIVGNYKIVIKDESGNEKLNATVTVAGNNYYYFSIPEDGTYTVEAGPDGVKYMRMMAEWEGGNWNFFTSNDKLLEVVQFGTVKWESMKEMFQQCKNMTFASGIDTPDLSKVTNMNNMFRDCSSFNQPLDNWDVSKVTDMAIMFGNCSSFNQPLNNWKIDKVTDIFGMFYGCSSFNQPLNSWKVDNVTDMRSMFENCRSFNQPLNNWDVTNVTDMEEMFHGCASFNQPLNNWNVTNVTRMYRMFQGCSSFNQPLDKWNVSNVTAMMAMFSGCRSFNQPLNNWDVSKVTYMGEMFDGCSSFNQPLNNWNVSKVTGMIAMFRNCSAFNQPLDKWIVSKVTSMWDMFRNCFAFNQPLDNWDVSKVVSMSHMFENCRSFNQPLNNWNVSNVTNMKEMFHGCASFNQPLNNWKVSNVTNMAGMFHGCRSFNQPLNNWNVTNVTKMDRMFQDCKSFNQPLDNWNVSNVTEMWAMFSGCSAFNQLLGSWNIKTVVGGLSTTAMSPSNYSATLAGWAAQNEIAKDLDFSDHRYHDVFGLIYNNEGKAAREKLMGKGWRFDGDIHQPSGVAITPYSLLLVGNKEFTLSLDKWGVEETEELKLSTDTEGIISYELTADKKGVHIKGLKEGKCKLTATIAAKAGVHEAYTSTCKIEVYIPIEHFTITPASKTLKVGADFTFTANIFPENATGKSVSWYSNNSEIATVDNNGKVTVHKVGKCTIEASIHEYGYGIYKKCEVTVVDEIAPVTSITLLEKQTITVGATVPLIAVVKPDNAEQALVWSSSDPEIATVSEGIVWGKKKGECTITVKSLDPTCSITKECKITVEDPSNGGNNGSGENNGGGNSGGGNNGGNNGGGNSGGNSGNNGGENNGGNNGGGDNNGSNPTTFSVTLTQPANGKIEIEGHATKSSITVAKDTELTVKATPNTGYKLKSLKAGDEDITTTLKFTVKAATTVTALFEKETFAVTTSVNNEAWGSIALAGASDLKAVAYDTELTVTVTEKEGYKLKSLKAGEKDITTTKKFIVKAATEVKAIFESKQGGAVEDALLAGIVVAPNPFTAQLRILNPEGVAARYELVNASGIVVRSGALSGSEAIVDTEALPAGFYFVRLEAQNGAQKSVMVSK